MKHVSIAVFVCALSTASAQNLLQNSDFEASSFSIAPWTFGGYAENIQVEKFSTNGADSSNAYAATCVGTREHILSQKVTLAEGKTYVLRLDTHATNVGRSYWSLRQVVEVKSGNKWTSIAPAVDIVATRGKHAIRSHGYRFTTAAAVEELRFRWLIPTYNYVSYRLRVDDFELFEAGATSMLFSSSNRSLATWGATVSMQYSLVDDPGLANIVFLGAKRLARGIKVAPFGNELLLDPSNLLLPLTVLVTDVNGRATQTLPFPKAAVLPLVGQSIYYQPVAFNPLRNVMRFGLLTNLPFVE